MNNTTKNTFLLGLMTLLLISFASCNSSNEEIIPEKLKSLKKTMPISDPDSPDAPGGPLPPSTI